LKRGNGPPRPRGAKGAPRCGRGVGTTPRTPCLTSVSPRNDPVLWGKHGRGKRPERESAIGSGRFDDLPKFVELGQHGEVWVVPGAVASTLLFEEARLTS
jgi:hypothetical protein